MKNKILAWHFFKDDGAHCSGERRPELGDTEILSVNEQSLESHYWWLHTSRNILEALDCAQGCLLRRIELSSDMSTDNRKICAMKQRELWRMDVTDILHEFACWCADRALKKVREVGYQVPSCYCKALEAKRGWLRGEINDETLSEICSGMQDAQWDASAKTILLEAAQAATFAVYSCAVVASSFASYYTQEVVAEQTRDYSAVTRERNAQRRKLLKMIEKAHAALEK